MEGLESSLNNEREVKVMLIPDKIEVVGPKSVLSYLNYLETEPIQISRLNKEDVAEFEIAVVFSPFSVKPAPGEPHRIRLIVQKPQRD